MHFQALEKMGNTWIPPYLNDFWGMLSLRIGWEMLVCVQESTHQLHAEIMWSNWFTDNYKRKKQLQENQKWYFFLQLKEQSSNNKWFCVKSSLPSDLKLNTCFPHTVRKGHKCTEVATQELGEAFSPLTVLPGTWMQTHLPAEWSWNKSPLPSSGKDPGHWATGYFCLCVRGQLKGERSSEFLPWKPCHVLPQKAQ